MHTIIVDDDVVILKLLEHQLATLGFPNTYAYASARDAVSQIEQDGHSVDVVLCDLQMPDMDGLEMVRHLATSGYDGGLVLFSAENDRTLDTAYKLASAYDLKVLGVLRKPISIEALGRLLERYPDKKTKTHRPQIKTYEANAIRFAIDHNELDVHYQPQVILETGELVAVEALVRWRHPQDGLVFPDQFVPVAEAHDLIKPLTQAVLNKALQDAKKWHKKGLTIRVAVNVSMDDLLSLSFPELIGSALGRAKLPPEILTLEVTETRLMQEPRRVLENLARLRLKHVELAIDDFGTGYSSLKQLRDLPFDKLKVDRSFVHQALSNQSNSAILEGSLAMARRLGMKTVGEGIENMEDWIYLKGTKCNYGQGYFIARPMPADALPAWHTEWKYRTRRPGHVD